MVNPLIRKLENFTRLSGQDKHLLSEFLHEGIRHLGPREDIIREGERPQSVNLVLSGWACRYKYLEDGRRQIIAFLVPGDLCDNNFFLLRQMDHSIGALTPISIAQIPRHRIEEVSLHHPRVAQALSWEALTSMAIQREWTVSLGQRDAQERLAHLLCELYLRLRAVGLTDGTSCELPLRQAELADALGLSTVHVNRTLQELRASQLIMLKGKTLTIPDLNALRSVAQFTPTYLHLEHEGRHLDANE
ncbi:Crp/Fnr family transcriptional regulator [Roseomonas sp. SSH11]|uniref:Crp/Fnr family transcriptional regulator n=1 Tax=Pararoseomonas baculiformis TaxID=2820812 RepID=A0ABS4AE43_9PROT|nr:Crp/Fnr family transcriptional regulator [Pararoseomonas baculiformis]MBP0445265.1 Crp/Fnr family transcriptional regulator [Pararoseomonas baculiformis]